jgi:hypothetical protein
MTKLGLWVERKVERTLARLESAQRKLDNAGKRLAELTAPDGKAAQWANRLVGPGGIVEQTADTVGELVKAGGPIDVVTTQAGHFAKAFGSQPPAAPDRAAGHGPADALRATATAKAV